MNKFLFSMILVPLIGLAGCDHVKAPHEIGTDQVLPGTYPRNVSVDPQVGGALVAGPTVVNQGSKDQPMSISQPMRNTKDFPLEVQYQFTFLDQAGKPIPTSGGWRNLTMEPRVERFMEGAALDTNAVEWRLTVRPAK